MSPDRSAGPAERAAAVGTGQLRGSGSGSSGWRKNSPPPGRPGVASGIVCAYQAGISMTINNKKNRRSQSHDAQKSPLVSEKWRPFTLSQYLLLSTAINIGSPKCLTVFIFSLQRYSLLPPLAKVSIRVSKVTVIVHTSCYTRLGGWSQKER